MSIVASFFNNRLKISLRQERAVLLVCTLIALLFWFFVKLSKSYRSEYVFDVIYLLPDEEAFLDNPPAQLNATVEGEGWDLLHFSLFNPRSPLIFDLRDFDLPSLDRRYLIDRLQRKVVASNVRIADLREDLINLSYEKKVSKKVPVRASLDLQFAPEHHLRGAVGIEPDSVELTGPVSLIDPIEQWRTDSTQLEALQKDVQVELPLARPQQEVIQIEPALVTVTVPVETFVEKTFLFVPVLIKNAPDSISIFPSTVKIVCVVGMSHYNEVSATDFTVEADLQGISPRTENNTVPLQLTRQPAAARSVRFVPASVEFFFQLPEVSGDRGG